ncbi:hypothetical protein L7F22_022595 [Adiantum nelumboides]|nr:hypothetical protein [Adiantum nelumboides]
MVRYFARKGLEPGKSWKKEKRREIELDSNEMSFSSSSKGSRVEKVGLGLVSNQRPWQFSGIVKSQLSKERTTSNNDDVSSSTDLAISIRDHSPEPKFSNLISSVLPFSLQPFFKNFIRFTSIWPIRPMLDLMRDGWHLILKGSKIGIHSEGFFRDVSKRKREEDLKEKIDEHAFLGWDSNQRTRGSIKRRRNNQLFAESSFAPEDELMTRSHQRRRFSSSSSSTSIYSINSISKSNLKDDNKTKIAKSGALVPLTRLARSKDMRVQRNATGALLNMTHSDENRQQLVNAGAIPVLVGLLGSSDTDVQYYSLRNLASDEKYQIEIVRSNGLPPLLSFTFSRSPRNSAAALGNLSSKSDEYAPFNAVWNQPDGGLHGYLARFLDSQDSTFQHIAVWTIVQLLESGDAQLEENVRSSNQLLPLIKNLSTSPNASERGSPRDNGEGSDDGQSAEGEISSLARKIQEMLFEGTDEGTTSGAER